MSNMSRTLLPPVIITPQTGNRYDKYVEITTDISEIMGTLSQRSFYQFYYSSQSNNIHLTPISINVPIDIKRVIWNTIDLPAGSDYVIQAHLSDDDGNISNTVLINIQIIHEGFFLIDTTPPVGSIVINDNSEFTGSSDVSVKVVSYDETTGVQSMQLIEGGNISNPEPPSEIVTFTLSTTDGTKTVELLLQDFGGNRNNGTPQVLFEALLSSSIVDICKNSNSCWAITAIPQDGDVSPSYSLYQITNYPSIIETLVYEPTCLGVYNNQIYIGTVTNNNNGILYFYNGTGIVSLHSFANNDSCINSMVQHGNKMFIGMENGDIYVYDGATFSLVEQIGSPVNMLMSDGSSLFLAPKNDSTLYVYNSTSFTAIGGV